MKTSALGLNTIAFHEGIVLRRYKDAVNVWTIGIGHTAMSGQPDPKTVLDEMTVPEVVQLFVKRIKKYEAGVNRLRRKWTQSEYDALVSFTFNCGEGNLQKLCKGRTKAQIAQAIMTYNKAGRPLRVLSALTKRREEERQMFLSGKYYTGKIPIWAVNPKTEKPIYRNPKYVDIRPYIDSAPAPAPRRIPKEDAVTPAETETPWYKRIWPWATGGGIGGAGFLGFDSASTEIAINSDLVWAVAGLVGVVVVAGLVWVYAVPPRGRLRKTKVKAKR